MLGLMLPVELKQNMYLHIWLLIFCYCVCLIFSNNQLKDLPDELASLHQLREIAISYNRYILQLHTSCSMGGGLTPVKQPGLCHHK